MDKVPITYREKVEARYINRGRGPCWMWEGSLNREGWPQLNLRNVLLNIYEWERGPVPPGHFVVRTDHRDETCERLNFKCRHNLCVNPWHIEFRPHEGPLYARVRKWDQQGTDHTAYYKRVQRARKKEKHDQDGDPQGDDAGVGGHAGQGNGVASEGVSQSDRSGDSH